MAHMARRSFKYPKYNITFYRRCTYGELHAVSNLFFGDDDDDDDDINFDS